MTITIQVLVTVSVLTYALVAAAADLNGTHATNPRWVGHARFHVVWQVVTHIGVGVIALVLTWVPLGPPAWRIGAAMALTAVILGGFFLTAATMPLYGGELADPNGYRPLRVGARGRRIALDQNVLLFLTGTGVLLAALVLVVVNQGVR
ncbi:hypothetical protein [Rhodococcoides kroppenstedtii]|uniref:hypothetical protein n=1 Tax=Rhodococcoides kroppenstedtii TaxID=293050 RepID=UPI001427B224|nr:hypothetical protein [Rhodococcus kroppenstedtii]NIL80393.1 hypothetical protein [Rhodococcus kroppenstedtii]